MTRRKKKSRKDIKKIENQKKGPGSNLRKKLLGDKNNAPDLKDRCTCVCLRQQNHLFSSPYR
jgi:hypothetical protein